MSQEGSGAMTLDTRVTVGQLVVMLKPQSRCLVSNMTLVHYQEQPVEALLLHLDEQGQPLHELIPLFPASLVDSELCRIVWQEQTIALSLHQRLDEELTFLQSLAAMRHWIMEHPSLRRLVASQEARNSVMLVDPIRITQLRCGNEEVKSDEQTDHGY